MNILCGSNWRLPMAIRPPLQCFMRRYVAAYANEIDAFISLGGKAADPVGRDGLNAADCRGGVGIRTVRQGGGH